MSVDTDTLAQLAPDFSGRLLLPADAEYDDARRVHNGLVDKHPALIARCRGVADVSDAVKLAHALKLEVSVRGGGHNVAGHAVIDGGLMIDLALMTGIHVDPRTRLARAQGGVHWSEFNRETQIHGLATTGGVVGSTGIAGLTLGGGLGWLMPKYGLALDNLRSAEMVMADGSVTHASVEENPDLFWAIRGGGGNFGIAASLEYALHPVGPLMTGGLVAYPISKAVEVFKFFREQCASAPDEVMMLAGLMHAPDGSGEKLVAIVAGHCGSLANGEEALGPLKAFGQPILDAMGPIPYCALNSMFDGGLPRGALNYWKSQFLADLTDEAIGVLVERFASCESPMSQIFVEHFHGAASRVPVSETAFAMRMTGFNVGVVSQWMDHRQNDASIAWCRATFGALKPFFAAARYVNYLDHDEVGDPLSAAYGPNYRRLRQLKAKYDPENFFHTNVNIRPA
jgi:FAD/FMN-containing dehydrogenase